MGKKKATRKKTTKKKNVVVKKKRKELSVKEAKKFQKTRSEQARTRDSKTTSKKVIKDERWKKKPGSFDYPKVDTRGYGMKTKKEKDADLKLKKEKDAKKLKDAITKLNLCKSGMGLVKVYNYHYGRIKIAENRKKLKEAFDRNAKRLEAKEKKEIAQRKKDREKYDKEEAEWSRKHSLERDKEYVPQLKEAIKKLNNFHGETDDLIKLFNREYNKVGTSTNRNKLSECWLRNERRLRVEKENKKLKESIKKEENPEQKKYFKDIRKGVMKKSKKYIATGKV